MLSASRLLRRSSRLLTSDAKAPLALHGILSPLHEIGPISFTSFKSKPDKPWPSALRYYLAQRHWFDDTKSEQVRTAPNLRDAFAVAYSPTINSWDGESSSGDPRQPPHVYWESIRVNVLRRGVHELAVNGADSDFRTALEETGDRRLIWEPSATEVEALYPAGVALSDMEWGRVLQETRSRLREVPLDVLRTFDHLPPKLELPEIARGSIGWRMGIGEHYNCDLHPEFMAKLSPTHREHYDRAFGLFAIRCAEGWLHW